MNFFVNDAMGIGNSGVEHAQFYRAARFDQAGLPYRFIFMGLVPELHQAMDKWHLQDAQVLNLWEYLVLGEDYLRQGLTKRTKAHHDLLIDGTDTQRLNTLVTDSGMRIVHHLVKYPDLHAAENPMLLVSNGRTEIYNAKTNQRRVMYQSLDDADRGVQLSNIHLYHENGEHLFFRDIGGLYRYFFERLDAVYGGHSTFLIDRGEHVDQALMNNRLPDSKLVYMVHADHLSDRDVPAHPLWNDHYEYMFDNLDRCDKVVVATRLQRNDMRKDFPQHEQTFVAIPVGGVNDNKVANTQRSKRNIGKTLKLITASRLASEKHIDLIVRAVAKLQAEGQAVQFDIYGQGDEHAKLKDLIRDLHAEDSVHLMGMSDHLVDIYPQYDAFISASFSEGFGLTYIEALNAALPIVTYKARFGAVELVHDGDNGFLADFKRDDDDYSVAQLVAGIKRLLAADYKALHTNTIASVAEYADHVTAEKWRALIDEL
jgi:accessory Sec system glycosylation protein GtfA